MPSEPRLALVTGAGGGLGRAFCLQLAAASGWHVMALDVDEGAGRETASLMGHRRTTPGSGEFVSLDVTDRDAWLGLAERIAAAVARGALPRPALLINNAGVCAAAETLPSGAVSGEASTSQGDAWRRLMDVNYFGALNGCQAMGPLLRDAVGPGGTLATAPRAASLMPRIINVASIFGLLSAPSLGAYAASKAALVAMSEALYAELRPAGVGVTVVAPGFFASRLLERGEFCSELHRAQAEQRSRDARFTADDVARAALAASGHGRLYCVLGARARWLWRLKRLAPVTFCRFAAWNYRRAMGGDADDSRGMVD